MFGPKRDEVTEEGWSLHDEMVHDLPALNILWVIKMKVLDEACSTYEVQVRCTVILVV
jgi:hypothetical protein